MKKSLSLFLIFFLFFSAEKNSLSVGINAIYISNNDPQFIALCAVGAGLAGAGIYSQTLKIGAPCVIAGLALILGSKEILLACNKAILKHQVRKGKETIGEKISSFLGATSE